MSFAERLMIPYGLYLLGFRQDLKPRRLRDWLRDCVGAAHFGVPLWCGLLTVKVALAAIYGETFSGEIEPANVD